MEFAMFRNYEGHSRSGYGSQSDCYKYVGYENGQLMFKSVAENSNHVLKATKDEFLGGLNETYLHAYHRYQLASNYDRDEVVGFIQGL